MVFPALSALAPKLKDMPQVISHSTTAQNPDEKWSGIAGDAYMDSKKHQILLLLINTCFILVAILFQVPPKANLAEVAHEQ